MNPSPHPTRHFIFWALVGASLFCAPVHAADAAKGKARAAVCAACHGPAGKATMPNTPNLAGQVPAYLAIALKAYRDGKRNDPMMSPMAKSLTDADIADLVAYYSTL